MNTTNSALRARLAQVITRPSRKRVVGQGAQS